MACGRTARHQGRRESLSVQLTQLHAQMGGVGANPLMVFERCFDRVWVDGLDLSTSARVNGVASPCWGDGIRLNSVV